MGRLAKEAVIHQLAPSGPVGINIHDLTKRAFLKKILAITTFRDWRYTAGIQLI